MREKNETRNFLEVFEMIDKEEAATLREDDTEEEGREITIRFGLISNRDVEIILLNIAELLEDNAIDGHVEAN